MAIPKVVLFYAFRPLADPDALRLWQRDLCEGLGLSGRILLSRHGINATVGGDVAVLEAYVRKTREYAHFGDLDVRWSDGTGLDDEGHSRDFPRLVVKVRDEIVSFGVPDEVVVDEHGIVGGGMRLTPDALDALVAERGDDVVLFDGRNAVEEEVVGRFRGALVPDIRHTSDFVRELDAGRWDALRGRPVVAYCTGGIRCEVLTSRLHNREDLPGRPVRPVCDAHALIPGPWADGHSMVECAVRGPGVGKWAFDGRCAVPDESVVEQVRRGPHAPGIRDQLVETCDPDALQPHHDER